MACRIVCAVPARAAAQLLPFLLFLAIFFALPDVSLISYSFLTQSPRGIVGLPPILEHYKHFFGTPLYAHGLWTTLPISLCTTAIAALLAYPVALVMVRAGAIAARMITMVVAITSSDADSPPRIPTPPR